MRDQAPFPLFSKAIMFESWSYSPNCMYALPTLLLERLAIEDANEFRNGPSNEILLRLTFVDAFDEVPAELGGATLQLRNGQANGERIAWTGISAPLTEQVAFG